MASPAEDKLKPSSASNKKVIWVNGSSPQGKSFVTPPQSRKKVGSPDAFLPTPPAPAKRIRRSSVTVADEDPNDPILPLHLKLKETSKHDDAIVDPSLGCKQEIGAAETVPGGDKPKEEVIFDNDTSSSEDEK
ncbi:unnamed protein product [Symbiodinium sp. CCMP2592]|nr:unnamed protein product [Symbiodinium sp. CCMP2592]